MVVVGVRSPPAASAAGGVTSMKSAPSTTLAPSLRSSAAIAAMRSVSLTRQLAMLRRAASCRRHTAPSPPASSPRRGCGCSRASIGPQRPARRAAPRASPGRRRPAAPIARAASTKRMSPWIESRPTPSMRSGASMRADGAERDEVRRRRRVAFDVDVARRAIGAARRDREALPAVALHVDAEARQQVQRDLDVGLGDQLAVDLDRRSRASADQRQRQQQRAQELARHVAAHADRRVECAARRRCRAARSGG